MLDLTIPALQRIAKKMHPTIYYLFGLRYFSAPRVLISDNPNNNNLTLTRTTSCVKIIFYDLREREKKPSSSAIYRRRTGIKIKHLFKKFNIVRRILTTLGYLLMRSGKNIFQSKIKKNNETTTCTIFKNISDFGNRL